ncbi:YIP1 family protein [Haloparvum sp. PAK95]|uniref:YIP1 family protein n=1 Tax=Haloparvum sp. PAK95 TaxID=3418962 RepID=UPI003D2F3AB7
MPSTRETLRQLLLHPTDFFERRRPADTLPYAVALVVVLAIATVVGTFVVGSMLAGAIDATVTMDNPERPPDWMCEDADSQGSTPTGCDEPETVERDAGALVYDAVTGYAPLLLFAPFVMWVLGAIVLNVAGRLVEGSPTWSGTFALSGWAALPELGRLVVGVAALRYALWDTTITSVQQAPAALEAAMAPVAPIVTVATILTVGWQWHLLSGGLAVDADVHPRAAHVAVGVPLGVWLLLALA